MINNDPEPFVETLSIESPPPEHNFFFTTVDLLRLFFTVIIYDLIAGMIASIVLTGNRSLSMQWFQSLVKIFIYLFPVLMTVFRAVKRAKYNGNNFGIAAKKISVGLVPVILVLALSLVIPFSALSGLIPLPKLFKTMFADMVSPDLISLLLICLIAPVLEEILCRGIVLQGLLNRYSPVKAIFFSALFFSVIHLNPWQGIPAFFIGLIAGWMYFNWQSILPAIVLHAAYNTGVVCFSLFHIAQKNAEFFTGSRYLIVMLGSALIFGFTWLIIRARVFNRLPVAQIQPIQPSG